MPVTLEGGPELVAALGQLTDTREITAQGTTAGALLQASARDLAPSASGALSGSVDYSVSGNIVNVGSSSPYARWFHVPYLSDGGVRYAKVDRAGRTYGRPIPDNPFLIRAVLAKQTTVAEGYEQAVADMVARAFSQVPR